jgi:hypothetical protein
MFILQGCQLEYSSSWQITSMRSYIINVFGLFDGVSIVEVEFRVYCIIVGIFDKLLVGFALNRSNP